ncbi:hypothetical protein [Candidatus Similichlamydia laticola]|uniref:Na(+)-translocating NADH-quinone reductase subunit A n=1 Tax=Candidatus Similichlamydia laticola TaxID=2170265 RepID=A0A369KJL7_9BACT|nr:hypothetical protein [Candidatus Similichlamydia laticola]RDB31166.1 Na(+)-translocating NADH-quinone reductase subunit A [Candidatus Similichlamydia laticola]
MSIYIDRGIHPPLLTSSPEVIQASFPPSVSLDVSSFRPRGFVSMVKEGEKVRVGSPILRHVSLEGLYLVSPVAGHVHRLACSRGCRPDSVEIFLAEKQEALIFPPLLEISDPSVLVREMGSRGLLTCVRSMPCDVLPNPSQRPRAIFVKTLESAPGCFSPFAWLKLYWNDFVLGLRLLQRICPHDLHVISDMVASIPKQSQLEGIHYHQAKGPHPVGNGAVHVHFLDRITSLEEVVWLLSARDVVAIGKHGSEGLYWPESFFSIFHSEKPVEGVVIQSILGAPVQTVLAPFQDRHCLVGHQFISGHVFGGARIGQSGFMRLQDHCLTLIGKRACSNLHVPSLPFSRKMQFLYCPNPSNVAAVFPFDHAFYECVFPMDLPLVHLLRACWASDLEEAKRCGLLEISLEEAALLSAVCPARFDFVSLIEKALQVCYNDHSFSR